MIRNERFFKPLLLSLSLTLTACSPVQPWERGNLARPQMAPITQPEVTELTTHVYGSREAASGGSSTTGGGCGCY